MPPRGFTFMKKPFLTLITATFVALQGFAQNDCDIANHFEDFISVRKTAYINKADYNQECYLEKQVVETNKKSCFSDLINQNISFADYLYMSFTSSAYNDIVLQLPDSLALRKAYFKQLRNDSLFTAIMTEWMAKTIDHKTPKDTVSLDQLINIAVKYFSIRKIDDEGYYVGKICVGANDIRKTETERKPFVEAFCFSSILKHLQGSEFNMYSEFVKVIKELYKVNLGVSKEEKLLRAQGAAFLLMRNNESLKSMLKMEYNQQKEYLPFVLIPN